MRLLLAAKNGQTHKFFQEAAATLGTEVVACVSLAEASGLIRERKFDAIFAEATLAGLTKWEITRVVRESKLNRQAPIVLLTEYGRRPATTDGRDNLSFMIAPSDAFGVLPYLKDLKRKLVAERRNQRRLPYSTEVNCHAGLKRLRARSLNLSATGLLLEGLLPWGLGAEFEAVFQLETTHPVFRASVRVTRIDSPRRIAVAFQNLSPSDRHRLRAFIDRHAKSPG